MSVYFLAYRGVSPLSRLIRFVTAGDYSHIGLSVARGEDGGLRLWRLTDGDRPRLELGAWGKWYRPWDVRLRVFEIDAAHRPGTRVDLYRLPCTEREAEAIFDFYRKRLGAPYDWLGALTSVVPATHDGKRRWFCSEIAYAACLAAGVRLLNETRAAKVTPRIFCLSPYLKRVREFETEGRA